MAVKLHFLEEVSAGAGLLRLAAFGMVGQIGHGVSLVWGPRLSRPSRSEEHTSELQSLMRISYAVFCLQKTNTCKSPILIFILSCTTLITSPVIRLPYYSY